MGDGKTYQSWSRRGVPIPHVVIMCGALFLFGRITAPGFEEHPVPGQAGRLSRARDAEDEVQQVC